MREHDSYRPLIEGAFADGWLLTRINDAGGGGRQPGDLMGLTHTGRGTLVEIKVSERSVPSPHQTVWLDAWQACGGLSLLVLVTKGVAVVQIWQSETRVSLTIDRNGRWRGWPALDR